MACLPIAHQALRIPRVIVPAGKPARSSALGILI